MIRRSFYDKYKVGDLKLDKSGIPKKVTIFLRVAPVYKNVNGSISTVTKVLALYKIQTIQALRDLGGLLFLMTWYSQRL